MSIRDVISGLEETRLFAVRSEFLGEETPRFVFVSEEVGVFLWQPDTIDDFLSSQAKAVMDDFVEGGQITVGWDPHDKDTRCMMARVDSPDPDYEIWDVRVVDPRPGVRILGGFVEKDTFVAIYWDYRENFDDHWDEQIQDCIAEWKRLFGAYLPFKGTSVDDYLSEPVKAV